MKGKRAPLMPREHGAYAMLTFPALTALFLGEVRSAPLLLVAATVATFLAHEQVTILTGGRGGRVKSEHGKTARWRALLLGVLASALGIAGLWLGGRGTWVWALVPISLAALWIPLILRRQEKTLSGELLVAVTLAATMLPVAAAGGVAPKAALAAALGWAAVFIIGTLTVHAVITTAKKQADSRTVVMAAPIISSAIIVAGLFIASSGKLPALAALAAVPTASIGLLFSLLEVHPKHLRRLGWSLVAGNVAAFLALTVGLS